MRLQKIIQIILYPESQQKSIKMPTRMHRLLITHKKFKRLLACADLTDSEQPQKNLLIQYLIQLKKELELLIIPNLAILMALYQYKECKIHLLTMKMIFSMMQTKNYREIPNFKRKSKSNQTSKINRAYFLKKFPKQQTSMLAHSSENLRSLFTLLI